jgi:hypothetical protein
LIINHVLSIPETVPVNVGEAKFAFKSKAFCAAAETGLFHRWYCPHFQNLPSFYQFKWFLWRIQRCFFKSKLAIDAFKSNAVFVSIYVAFKITCIVYISKPTIVLSIQTVPVKLVKLNSLLNLMQFVQQLKLVCSHRLCCLHFLINHR